MKVAFEVIKECSEEISEHLEMYPEEEQAFRLIVYMANKMALLEEKIDYFKREQKRLRNDRYVA